MNRDQLRVATLRFQDRWIAEAIRLEEDRQGAAFSDPKADETARQCGGDFEQRILTRALTLSRGRQLVIHLRKWRLTGLWLVVALLALAFFSGAGAARAVLGHGSEVNVGLLLVVLLGLPLGMLLLWLVWIGLPCTPSRSGWAGQFLLSGLQWILRRPVQDSGSPFLIPALSQLLDTNGAIRWWASSLTHALWLGFTLGAFFFSSWQMTFRQYDFVWGTTVLREEHFIVLLTLLGTPAQWLGWSVPGPEMIQASRMGIGPVPGREYWSTLILSGLFFFGILPRWLLLMGSFFRAGSLTLAIRLPTALPGYSRLSRRLQEQPSSKKERVPSVSVPIDSRSPEQEIAPPEARSGEVFLLGYELDRESSQWPPYLPGVSWQVLGRVDEYAQELDLMVALRHRELSPKVIVVLFSLLRTPDRGMIRFLRRLRSTSQAPVWALLEASVRGNESRPVARSRKEQWEKMVQEAGVDWVTAVDLGNTQDRGTRDLLDRLHHFPAEDRAS